MTRTEPPAIRFHESPDLFRAATQFTAAETHFAARLIEKDYFCSVLVEYLAAEGSLVFKGGTCLAKVYAGFYRLSEDLDFVIPTAVDASRAERLTRLQQQLEPQLKPVLREKDFREFELVRAFGAVTEMAKRLDEVKRDSFR